MDSSDNKENPSVKFKMNAQLKYGKLVRTTLVLFLCFIAQVETFATHISGAEISYKHLFANTYKFTLKVYRDCRECKFNNVGGGDNISSCNEVPDMQIRGAIGTNYANTSIGTIEMQRISIKDLSSNCYSSVSKCRQNSSSFYGYEVHVFEGTFDFSNPIAQGYCKFDVSIGMSSRNININNQFTEQNFFNYAQLNLCEGKVNNSTEFTSAPQFQYFANQSNFQSLGVVNSDGDSLSFSLKPALRNRTVSVSYATGYDFEYPFSFYCSGSFPCTPNINGPLVEGFYCSKTTGDIAFTPNIVSQGGVVVVECEEWKKDNNGQYYLAGITRRDIYSDIIAQNNSLPKIKNRVLEYTVCEGSDLKIDLDIEDLPVLGGPGDTVQVEIISTLPPALINRLVKNITPFYTYSLQTGNTSGFAGVHYITVIAKDNNCPLRGIASKTFIINVLKSQKNDISYTVKNCGMLDVSSTNLNTNIFWTITDINNVLIKQQQSRKIITQLPKGGRYIIKSYLPVSGNTCELNQFDTIDVKDFTKPEINMGADQTVCEGTKVKVQPILLNTYDNYSILVNGLTTPMPFEFEAKGMKNLVFRVVQEDGCFAEDNIRFTLYPKLVYAVKNDTICVNSVFPYDINSIKVDESKIFVIDLQSSTTDAVLNKLNLFDWQMDMINPTSQNIKLFSLIQDKNFCNYRDTFNISVVEPDAINVSIPDAVCINSEPIKLPVERNGYWECISNPSLEKDNVLTIDIRDRSPIELRYTENVKCRNVKNFTVQVKDTSALSFAHSKDLKLCQSQSPFELKPSPNGGNWFGDFVNGNNFDAYSAAGTKNKLIYTYSNLSDCISRGEISIEVEKLPELKVVTSKSKICVGDILTLNAETNSTEPGYWFTDGSGVFDNNTSITANYTPSQSDVSKSFLNFVYVLQTTGVCGDVSAEAMVVVKSGQVGEIFKNYPLEICEPALITFKSNFKGIEKQFWLVNDSVVEEFDYNFDFTTTLMAGEYNIKTMVYDSVCQAVAVSEKIKVWPLPDIKFHSNPSFKLSREYPRLYLRDETECVFGHKINWYINNSWIGNSDELNYKVEEPRDTFFIKLVARSDKGECIDSLNQMFVFIPINQLYIPNAFSPDSKGPNENNGFKVVGPAMKYFKIEIFNRFGEKVYMSTDMNTAWDGTYKGDLVIQGDYFYKIETTDLEGISRDYSGTVTVIR